jgi:hypothetical protein
LYAFVTSPSATGRYFFVALTIGLVLRPIRGVSQALQKLGSERGSSVSAYLGLTTTFAAGYLVLVGGVAYVSLGQLSRLTIFTPGLFGLAALFAVSVALAKTVESLVSAAGYPSTVTWLNAVKSGGQFVALLLLNPAITTVRGLMIVVICSRLVVFGIAWVSIGVVPTLPTRAELGRGWGFAKWSVPDQVLDRLSYSMPVYVLGIVASPLAVGIYETADRLADFGATIAWQLSSPLLTKVSGDDAAGVDVAAYLDTAVTGGTGVAFLVLGYLLAAHGLLADIAFSSARTAFSTTVLLVGAVNLFRAFWTLASHAIEAVGHPGVSFRTKLLGLAIGAPIPAVYGAEFGAVAGAAGYAVMNLAICGYVVYHARDIFGTSLVDTTVAVQLCLGLGVTLAGATVSATILPRVGLSPVGAALGTALVAIGAFATAMSAGSSRARDAFRKAYAIYLRDIRALLGQK